MYTNCHSTQVPIELHQRYAPLARLGGVARGRLLRQLEDSGEYRGYAKSATSLATRLELLSPQDATRAKKASQIADALLEELIRHSSPWKDSLSTVLRDPTLKDGPFEVLQKVPASKRLQVYGDAFEAAGRKAPCTRHIRAAAKKLGIAATATDEASVDREHACRELVEVANKLMQEHDLTRAECHSCARRLFAAVLATFDRATQRHAGLVNLRQTWNAAADPGAPAK